MKPILVFQTDFTYKEGAVSSMYGERALRERLTVRDSYPTV